MNIISHWAIFGILISYAFADSIKKENENTVGISTIKIELAIQDEEKHMRQRRDNVIEMNRTKNISEDGQNLKNIIQDTIRQTQHPIKKQIKFKRLRYLSRDQNNTKLLNDKLKEDTKELKLRFTDTDHFRFNNTPQMTAELSKNGTYDETSVKQSGRGTDNVVPRSENIRSTPSHRKKRRRIISNSLPPTASVATIEPVQQMDLYEPNVPRDHVIPFLDFGKKISATSSTRTNANFVDSLKQSLARVSKFDVDGKAIGKTDLLYVASTNLENYYKATIKPISVNATNSSICMTNYRTIRPDIKNLKREINLNNTLCRLNETEKSQERVNRQNLKADLKIKVDEMHKNGRGGFINESIKNQKKSSSVSQQGYEMPPSATTVANQFTTKTLSMTIITSVSMKTNDIRIKNKTITNRTPTTNGSFRKYNVEYNSENYKKPSINSRFFEMNNLSDVIFSVSHTTLRPSLIPYQRSGNSSIKNFRNINNNIPFSKLIFPLQSRPPNNLTLATTEITATITNTSEPDIEYLKNLSTSTEPEIDMSIEMKTPNLLLWNSSTTSVFKKLTKNDSSSTPVLVTYDGIEKDITNWIYHVKNETEENTTINPKVYTIFSRNVHYNYSNKNPQSLNAAPGKTNLEEELNDDGQTGFRIVTYILAGFGVIPLIIGIAVVMKMILNQNKKQIFEGSEYSSEYNRNPLEFNTGVTSSPIATKLPRINHQAHWEIEKKTIPCISIPSNSQWEFPRNKLRLQTILGQGNFGQVWKAEADDINGHEGLTRLVAVKMVKEISSVREKEDLIKELMIMQHLGSHPNVVTLLGCCTDKEPYMLIMEYVMYGKLLSFLRDHRTRTHYFNFSDNGDTLTPRDLTVFAYCVARGMEYLQNKQVIHRDLAARNILIDHNKLCKIADFGMSRYVENSGQVYEQRQNKGALPIRWMAPESLHYGCYTHKTDVWSFGILMWEIVTLGSMPYASMGARIVMRKVKDGYRLEKPKYCKLQLFNVINKCWHSDPNRRPSFVELKQELYNLLEDPEYLGNYVDLEGLAEEMNEVIHGSHNEKFIT